MRAASRAVLVLAQLLLALPTSAFAGGAGLARAADQVPEVLQLFKAGNYSRRASLAMLTARDLAFATKVDNVNGLLDLAVAERRIDTIDAMALSRRFSQVERGDELLLICLRNKSCHPDSFLNIARTSKLHSEVIRRNPALKAGQVDHEVGAMTERLMDRYFQHSGWTRVEGQVGRQGIDGLYVKREGEVVKDVLIAESKYNSSPLGTTNHGTQMSEEWTRRKVVELKARYPDQPVYDDIERYVDAGAYRAVLWNLKVNDEALYITVSKVRSKGGDVEITDASGTDVAELWGHPTNRIPLNGVREGFEGQVAGWYRAELDAIGPLAL